MENSKMHKESEDSIRQLQDSMQKSIETISGNSYKMGIGYVYATILHYVQQHEYTKDDICRLIYYHMKSDDMLSDYVYDALKNLISKDVNIPTKESKQEDAFN